MNVANRCWMPIAVTTTLLLCTWIANCVLLGGALQTASNGHVIPVAYFFVGSQAIGSLLHVTLNLPPVVIGIMFGSVHMESYKEIFCLYSTYLDTLFCNLTFLQTFFSSLDAYLRLRNPTFYLSSARRRPALWLKIGSPWLVAAMQSVGQLALSDRQQVRLHQTTLLSSQSTRLTGFRATCLLPDPNFLIIRTVIAYALPLLTCIILVALQLYSLRNIRNYPLDTLHSLIQMRVTRPHRPSLLNKECRMNTVLSYSVRAPTCYLTKTRFSPSGCPQGYSKGANFIPLMPVRQLTEADQLKTIRKFTHTTDENDQEEAQNRTNNLMTKSVSSFLFSSDGSLILQGTAPLSELADQIGSPCAAKFDCPTHGLASTMNQTHLVEEAAIGKLIEEQERMFEPNTSGPVELVNEENPSQSANLPDSVLVKVSFYNGCGDHLTDSADTSGARPTESDQTGPNTIRIEESTNNSPPCTRVHQADDSENTMATYGSVWLAAYNGEQLAVAINLVSCIIAVGTWSPYILATLANGLCQPIPNATQSNTIQSKLALFATSKSVFNQPDFKFTHRCFIQVHPDRVADFRWWAYASSGLLLPCLLFFLDLRLREGCWRALVCNTHREHRPFDQPVALKFLNTVQTYRCQSAFTENENSWKNQDSRVWHQLWNR